LPAKVKAKDVMVRERVAGEARARVGEGRDAVCR
jgi:hypothetical protein